MSAGNGQPVQQVLKSDHAGDHVNITVKTQEERATAQIRGEWIGSAGGGERERERERWDKWGHASSINV